MFDIRSFILFDRKDHVLLRIVNAILSGQATMDSGERRFFRYLHPRGIKEMAESRGIRIAHAVIHILQSLEVGRIDDRLGALRSLKGEVLNATTGPMPINTARALLQIMKEVVRAHGDYARQLELAHAFRLTVAGKPRIVREQLRKYHLLEMPEDWNQISFDDHVHDFNTKGRKSPTHLIMDAWIKGIRRLRVIHYNYIEPRSAEELQEAAEIMGISVRLGIEYFAAFRGRYVKLIWAPRGFPDSQAFLCFLAEQRVRELMDEGRHVSRYHQKYVLEVLDKFNRVHREELNQEYGVSLAPAEEREFLKFVGAGQASLVHLAKFIHSMVLPLLDRRIRELRDLWKEASLEKRGEIERLAEKMNRLDVDAIYDTYLHRSKNPDLPDPKKADGGPEVPALLRHSPDELLKRLMALRAGFRVTLNLSGLCLEDVVELLYDCEGVISRLELFNLKDFVAGETGHIAAINAFQRAVNDGNAIAMKKMIRQCIDHLGGESGGDNAERVVKLTAILYDIDTLKSFYKGAVLKSRIGSDSTGHSPKVPGMGLAVLETISRTSRKEALSQKGTPRTVIPIVLPVLRRTIHTPRTSYNSFANRFLSLVRRLPGIDYFAFDHREDWDPRDREIHMAEKGNIFTLGGTQAEKGNELSLETPDQRKKRTVLRWSNLNSHLKNTVKILLGFAPAFLTFFLNYHWWVLAYLGAFIWFGITGVRNIVQSVLGGGGFRRSPLLKWNDYVSWDRISDSLFFTGWSVPLLDFLVKNLLLDKTFGVTTATHPLVLYSCIAFANGVYLSSHNLFRGLPRTAAFWNFFRSVLSIPIAIGLNAGLEWGLALGGVEAPAIHLQKWAAVISKASSDVVAGIIEGTADRDLNIRLRLDDYREKISSLFDAYAKLEVLLPQVRVLEALPSLENKQRPFYSDAEDWRRLVILHSIDLLYFWMYQPRARSGLKTILAGLSDDERQILLQCQYLLKNNREIGQMFLDGLIGANFSKGLSFYLDRSNEYIGDFEKLAGKVPPSEETYSGFCVYRGTAEGSCQDEEKGM